MTVRRLAVFLLALLWTSAAADSWKPEGGARQVPIWPADAAILADGIRKLEGEDQLAKGFITNVDTPTYTVYRPKVNPSGTCVIVFPGGGHKVLAIELEGTEVAQWLTGSGITCVLVKYRVPYSGCYWDSELRKNVTPKVPMALQDAQRTISTIRAHAQDYGVDPRKIGVMGFSAGGNVAVLASTCFQKRSYAPIDAIDQVSCRPDFAIPVFAGHMTMEHKNVDSRALNTDIPISPEIPPTLLVHAKDDPVNPVWYSEVYAAALRKAGVRVKLKLYETGGHAFAVRKQGTHSDRWTLDALSWLTQIQMI